VDGRKGEFDFTWGVNFVIKRNSDVCKHFVCSMCRQILPYHLGALHTTEWKSYYSLPRKPSVLMLKASGAMLCFFFYCWPHADIILLERMKIYTTSLSVFLISHITWNRLHIYIYIYVLRLWCVCLFCIVTVILVHILYCDIGTREKKFEDN